GGGRCGGQPRGAGADPQARRARLDRLRERGRDRRPRLPRRRRERARRGRRVRRRGRARPPQRAAAGRGGAARLDRRRDRRVEADGPLELAICGALCERRREPVLVRPEDVEIEVRGAGNATRQINHIVKPEFPAERLLVVEVFTPSGNWSSYPPHKHDEDNPPGEVILEETYYFRTPASEAFAMQRLYSPRHGLDVTETVRDGDLMLVPHGYHTTAAAHG